MSTVAFVDGAYRFEGFTLDITRRTLATAEHEIELRPKCFDVLCCLVEHAGRLVTKDALFRVVWPGVSVTDESITRCVSDIRRALSDRDQRIIKTIPGRGYLLAAAVSRSCDAPEPVDTNPRNGTGRHASAPSDGIPVAVLPFTATSGNAAGLAERMTADLTNYLSRIKVLRVVANYPVAQHSPGLEPDLGANGGGMATRYVLRGAIYAEGDGLRVNLAAIDTRSGRHVWSHHFSEDVSAWPAAQEHVVRRTAFAVHLTLLRCAGAEALEPRKELSVSDLVARGRAGILDTEDSPLFSGSRMAFSEALRRDPECIGAMIGLAAYYLLAEPDQSVIEAERLLRRALARNTQNDAVHNWLGLLYRVKGNLAAAIESYDRAIEINPSHAPAYAGKGRALINLHRYEEALQQIRYAQRLNADTSIVTVWDLWAGWAELELGRADEARAAFSKAVAARPRGAYVHASLGALHALSGEWPDAHRHIAELRKLTPNLTDQQRLVEFSLGGRGHRPQLRLFAYLRLALEADRL